MSKCLANDIFLFDIKFIANPSLKRIFVNKKRWLQRIDQPAPCTCMLLRSLCNVGDCNDVNGHFCCAMSDVKFTNTNAPPRVNIASRAHLGDEHILNGYKLAAEKIMNKFQVELNTAELENDILQACGGRKLRFMATMM